MYSRLPPISFAYIGSYDMGLKSTPLYFVRKYCFSKELVARLDYSIYEFYLSMLCRPIYGILNIDFVIGWNG